MALGLIQLPKLSNSVKSKFKALDRGNTRRQYSRHIKGLSNNGVAGEASRVQSSNTNANIGSFKWVESKLTPESFANPADSVLIFAGDPLYSNMDIGEELVPIGLCQGFSFSASLNVTSV